MAFVLWRYVKSQERTVNKMADRNLDGIFMRIERGGTWDNVCLSDMTTEERSKALAGKSNPWLLSVIDHLCNVLRSIGDELDIWVGDIDG